MNTCPHCGGLLEESRYSFDWILQTVAHRYRLPIEDIVGPTKTRYIARARAMAMYLMRQYASASYPAIAKILGDRHHTTVLVGISRFEEALLSDRTLQKTLAEIEEDLSMPEDVWHTRAPLGQATVKTAPSARSRPQIPKVVLTPAAPLKPLIRGPQEPFERRPFDPEKARRAAWENL